MQLIAIRYLNPLTDAITTQHRAAQQNESL